MIYIYILLVWLVIAFLSGIVFGRMCRLSDEYDLMFNEELRKKTKDNNNGK